MAGSMEGKVALVTGAGSGIGRATALTFAREGGKVVVSDVNAQGGEETASMIREAGGEAIFVRADVSQAGEVEELINKAVGTYGRLDCAHNNAGVEGPSVPTHEYPEEEWDRVININLKGVWLCMKYEVRHMLKQGGGAIVNTSSAVGLVGVKGAAAYVAAKHGVVGLTKTAALEYARSGLRVNAVCPGNTRTPLLERILAQYPKREAHLMEMAPVKRLGTPEEIAEAVVWLCSDAASFVTGHAMPVDGGWVAQ